MFMRPIILAVTLAMLASQQTLAHEFKELPLINVTSSPDNKRLIEGFIAYDADEYDRAFERLSPFEKSGPARAQFLLAMMYLNGLTPRINAEKNNNNVDIVSDSEVAKGKVLLEAASNGGDSDATFILGYDQLVGGLIPRNEQEGLKYLRKAAEMKNAAAMYELGWILLEPSGLPIAKDRDRAFRNFLEIADRHDGASYPLALCYLHGYGTKADPFEAYAWSLVGMKFDNHARIREILVKADQLLTPAQRQKAHDVSVRRIQTLLESLKKARSQPGHGLRNIKFFN